MRRLLAEEWMLFSNLWILLSLFVHRIKLTTKPSNIVKFDQHNQDENNAPRDHKRNIIIAFKCHNFSFFWIHRNSTQWRNHYYSSENHHENNISDLKISRYVDQLLYNFSRRQIAFETHCSSSTESAANC